VSLFKRGNIWWSYYYQDGIRHQSSNKDFQPQAGRENRSQLKEEVNNQRFRIVDIDPAMKFGELAARFIASGSVRPHNIYNLKFLLPFFSDFPVIRITKSLTEELSEAADGACIFSYQGMRRSTAT